MPPVQAALPAASSVTQEPSPPTVALPPIGPAIEVSVPPKPPDSVARSPAATATLAAPISLLPSAAASDSPEPTPAKPKPAAPGPGSGGLY